MSVEIDQHQQLIEALVGQKWRGMYHNSAEFHGVIDGLAWMLPLWIDGLAEQAKRDDGRRNAELERMQNLPPLITDHAYEPGPMAGPDALCFHFKATIGGQTFRCVEPRERHVVRIA